MAKQFTNREEVFNADPENWEYLPDADKPVGAADSASPVFAPGATEPTTSVPGALPGDPIDQPAQVPADPRLGMNPQGGWTTEKVTAMFPGMTGLDTSQWLDPAEEAKRREGMPYDPSKKYDESKPYPGINMPAVPGAGGPDNRPPVLRMNRRDFERNVFAKIGGNPFLINPYDEVIKADKQLPELFNHVFQGQAVWSDLPKLDKDQRAYWEKIKKEHHERVYKEVSGKKKQMEEAYKWMMGQFNYDQKQAAAELARQDRLRAKQEAAAGKTPPFREIYNEDGIKTLHTYDATTGQWVESRGRDGKPLRTGQYSLEDLMPPNVRFAQAQINKLRPQIDPKMQAMLMMIPEKDRQKAMDILMPKISPEQEKELAQWEQVLAGFKKQYFGVGGQPSAGAAGGPVARGAVEKPAPEAKSNPTKDIALIVNAKKTKHPRLKDAIEAFRKKYPDASTQQALEKALGKLPGSHFTPEAGTAY